MKTMILSLLLFALLSPPLKFTTLAEGSESGIEEPREAVIQNEDEWKALWKLHAPDKPLPAIDFSKSTVIGIFLGFRNTGGYKVAITGIEKDASGLVVTWRETRPAQGAIVTQVLTFPYHLVRIDRETLPVKFHKADGPAR